MLAKATCFQCGNVLARSPLCLSKIKPCMSQDELLHAETVNGHCYMDKCGILELVPARKTNIAEELYLLDTMDPALRERLRNWCGWMFDEGYDELSSVAYRQQRFLQTRVIGSPLMNEVFTRELWLHSVVLHL